MTGRPPAAANPDTLAAAARDAGRRGPPPVHLWNPPFCGDIDMRIARDGTWFYAGTPIGREAMVRLFASILRRDGDDYFLVTPVEKVGITVEDAPFVAVDCRRDGDALVFLTNLGDETIACDEHPIRVRRDPESDEPAPYVHVRAALEARIDRKTFYRLVEEGEVRPHAGREWFGIASGGAFFPIQPAAEIGLDVSGGGP